MMPKSRSGFVTIIGRSNVGKSTFLNYVIGKKVAITTHKPQTTRNVLRGVYNSEDAQIVFVDTPGVQKGKTALDKKMNKAAFTSLYDVDLILYMIDCNQKINDEDKLILKSLKNLETPKFLVVNKIDNLKNEAYMVENVLSLMNELPFDEVFYISSLDGNNVERMLNKAISYLPEGEPFFSEDTENLQSEAFMISEIIREKILLLTREEIPHSVGVIIESIKEDEELEDLLVIEAKVIVEKASQKGIVIGKNGLMLKEIGTEARKEIVRTIKRKVYLELYITVEPNWRSSDLGVKKAGYE
ncbi:MAG TPA: GTPase Era [Bacilli bacterium]|jgi:GTP-binding protein Era|nr:GTPase Era [Bacilli bacterium]